MAVINQMDDKLTHPQSIMDVTGAHMSQVARRIEIAAGDDDGSAYLIAELPGSAVLVDLTLEGAAITGGSDYDIGIWDAETGAAIDSDKLADGLDLSSVSGLPIGPFGVAERKGLVTLANADINKPLWQLAGHVDKVVPGVGETQRKAKYRIGLLGNTAGGAGDLIARVVYKETGN